jgi:hypothetical protein
MADNADEVNRRHAIKIKYLNGRIRNLEKELSKALHGKCEAEKILDNERFWEKRCGELQQRVAMLESRENQRSKNRCVYFCMFMFHDLKNLFQLQWNRLCYFNINNH